ncbi:MAG: pilin [Candidatus Uhrbacteria bacterium]|nr:pilin [Candidatus Uhrbacteria bacterium]
MTLIRSMFLAFALLLVVGALPIAFASPVHAETEEVNVTASLPATMKISDGLDAAAKDSGYSTDLKIPVFIGNMIKTLLAATGIVFLIITVYAGILYMTAMGDTDKIKKAKGMLTSSVIGLIIIVGAYAITKYVVDAISQATITTV